MPSTQSIDHSAETEQVPDLIHVGNGCEECGSTGLLCGSTKNDGGIGECVPGAEEDCVVCASLAAGGFRCRGCGEMMW